MKNNKGLCMTCDFDVTCVFDRTFPVIFCEEFFVSKTEINQTAKKDNPINAYDDEMMENCFCGE